MATRTLTQQQESFCREYVRCGNGTESVRRAGYKCRSDTAAGVQAVRLLRNANVQLRIRELRDASVKGFTVSSAWILEQVASIANDKKQQAKDRLKALELLGKHAGTWEPEGSKDGVEVIINSEAGEWAK